MFITVSVNQFNIITHIYDARVYIFMPHLTCGTYSVRACICMALCCCWWTASTQALCERDSSCVITDMLAWQTDPQEIQMSTMSVDSSGLRVWNQTQKDLLDILKNISSKNLFLDEMFWLFHCLNMCFLIHI